MIRSRRVSWALLGQEPFRLFFPASVLVGLLGAALWPLYFGGVVEFYPGLSHARLMTYGFFGGFMIGFLGTALPRMISAKPFALAETAGLLALYGVMVVLIADAKIAWGDGAFLALLTAFGGILVPRLKNRQDVPPPSFVLVALAFVCAWVGALLSILVNNAEDAFFWAALQHLLAYQGFMLLPILGVGAFLFPRFFGRPNRQDFPASKTPPPGWSGKAQRALAAGLLIVASFWAEADGWNRIGPAVRLVVTLVYIGREVPLPGAGNERNTSASILRLAFALLLGGFLAIVVFPGYRVSLLHLTLVGGFALITLVVATRVVFGHSGNAALLKARNGWMWVTLGLMLLGMVTRITGDFVPKVLASHYSYGAGLWIVAVLLWSAYVLPKVLVPDPED